MVVDHAAEKRREKNREAQRKFRDTRKREEEEQAASLAAMESEVGALEDHFSQLQEEKDSLQFKLVELQTAPCMPLPNVSLNNSLLPLADVEYVDQDLIPPLVSTDLAKIPNYGSTQWPDIFDFDFDAPIDQSLQRYSMVDPFWDGEAAPNSALKIMKDLRSATTTEIGNLQMLIQNKQAIAQQIDNAIYVLQGGAGTAQVDWDGLNLDDSWPDMNVDGERFLQVNDDQRLFEL